MANLKSVIVVLLVITLVLSAVSVVFNLMIYRMKSSDLAKVPSSPSNAGNIGLVIESNSDEVGGLGG